MEKPEGDICHSCTLGRMSNLGDIHRWHWVDLFEDGGYEKLTQALKLRAEKANASLTVKQMLNWPLVNWATAIWLARQVF